MAQLQFFPQNMQLLIGILAFLAIGLIVLFAIWAGVRAWLFHSRQKQSEQRFRVGKYDAQGRPIPPTAPGICERCSQTSENVFHLPDGRRLCRKCFRDSDRVAP